MAGVNLDRECLERLFGMAEEDHPDLPDLKDLFAWTRGRLREDERTIGELERKLGRVYDVMREILDGGDPG